LGGILSHDQNGKERGKEVYLMGIIDILTTYDFKKKGEHMLKSFIHDANEISAIAPDPYRKRFLKYLSSIVD